MIKNAKLVQYNETMRVLRTCAIFLLVLFSISFFVADTAEAINIGAYRDTLSDSGPNEYANHSFSFTPKVTLNPGAYIEVSWPSDFTVETATTTFAERNVELLVNGIPRPAALSAGVGVDGVSLTRGPGGAVRYTLASDVTIPANSQLQLLVGNQTSGSLDVQTTFSTSTGTTTIPADTEPIQNSSNLGVHEVTLEIVDGGVIANTDFIIFLNEKVRATGDSTEEIPPFRSNGSPTSTVGGTTLSVEISLETDELAICKFSTASGTPFAAQPNTFSNTGFLNHSTVVTVTPDSLQQFFVRCIDDEGNFNIDDFVISFTVSDIPTGSSNTEGDVSGDGTGSGNDGSGSGSNAGGNSGAGGGNEATEGPTSGSGGSGGGGGGGSGRSSGVEGGGGFESTDGPYESGDGQVTISGYAYPNAQVVVMVDGQIANSIRANSTGAYSVVVDAIARGAYTFGVYAEDASGARSSTFSTSFTVSGARASRLSNINITPSITVDPDPAEPGEMIELSGYTLPNATVSLELSRSNGSSQSQLTAVSDSSGRWRTTFDTTGLARDTYRVRAKAEQLEGRKTNFSEYEYFGIGQTADRPLSPDLNRDGSVNLIDFSILLFWWQSNGGDSDPPADINQDGGVNLTDFSILLFNWTG